jgi:hypothetical protein
MTRILWIIGLSIALLVLSGFVVICLVALITYRHLNFKGWTMLVCGAFAVRFIFTGLRSAIRYGDPTKTASSGPADSSASGSEPGIPISR